MSEDRAPVTYIQSTGDDLVPGMVTVVEDAPVSSAPTPSVGPAGAPDGFDVVLRGYERHQVDAYLARVSVLVEQMRAELAGAVAREAAAGAELARASSELERGRPSFDALGERVSQMLGLAEKEADQMRSDADRDASALRQAAERESADIRSDARREAEELGAAARLEVTELADRRVDLLTEIAQMRDALNGILAGATEQWPSLSPSQEALPAEDVPTDDPEETLTIELAEKPSKART